MRKIEALQVAATIFSESVGGHYTNDAPSHREAMRVYTATCQKILQGSQILSYAELWPESKP